FKWNKYREVIHQAWVINLNTRIVFITTLVLLIAGTVIIYFLEYNYSLEEHKGLGKVVTAFFASVTPRSAGLHTFNTGSLLTPTILIIILLMWIGGSPASVAGGIKTSTFALAILNVISLARGKDRVELYRRKVSDISLRRAHAIIFLSLIVIGISVLLVSSFDPDKKLLDIVFECFSAYSTVGLSLGITQQLSEPSKFIIILTMFLGRMGTLTIMMAILKKVTHLSYKYPEENILIN
ncbi:MAG: potassium transporter TrkG, partial [Bacteroidales bacterium]|nr:potassium transporter TrkG [Bacteroidales bacterium]